MAAAYLARMLPPSAYEITLLRAGELRAAALFGVAHPDLRRFNKTLQINEVDFITTCNATFRLGVTVSGFGKAPYMRTFSQYGVPIDGAGFYDALLANNHSSHPADLEQYNLPAAMIQAGKFTLPADSSKPILSDFDYGYCFDTRSYAEMLCERTVKFGVKIIDSPSARLDADNTHVILGDDRVLQADLIVDATASQTSAQRESWHDQMPFSSYTVSHSDHGPKSLRLAPELRAGADIVSLSYDLQHSTIKVTFGQSGDIEFRPGRAATAWTGNVVRLGLSAMTLFPADANLTQIAQIDIERLVELFPPNLSAPIEREEYNRRTSEFYDRMRDFASLHLKTARTQGDIWDRLRAMALPQDAAYKLSLFSACGRIAVLDEESILKDSWHAMLLGHDIIPARSSRMAMNVTAAQLDANLKRLSDFISRAVSAMPSQEDFIARHCPASNRTSR